MQLLPILASLAALDWMLRAFGVAAIIYAFFMGLKALTAKPTPIPTPQPAAPPVAKPTAITPQTASQPAPDTTIAPEIVAIIAAAVSATLGSAHRIIAIKTQSSYWGIAGRQSVLTSHRIR